MNKREQYRLQNEQFLEEIRKEEGVKELGNGVLYKVLASGDGHNRTRVRNESIVTVRYKGSLINGKVFDSSYSGEPLVFPLNRVIPGWTEGLQYMKEGAKFRFVIPYMLAYGPSGYGPIPPYSTLIFEVELLEVL